MKILKYYANRNYVVTPHSTQCFNGNSDSMQSQGAQHSVILTKHRNLIDFQILYFTHSSDGQTVSYSALKSTNGRGGNHTRKEENRRYPL